MARKALADRVQGADLVERAERAASGQGEAEAALALRGSSSGGLQIEHDSACPDRFRRPASCAWHARVAPCARARRPRAGRTDSAFTFSFSSATRLVSRRISSPLGTPSCCNAFCTRCWNRLRGCPRSRWPGRAPSRCATARCPAPTRRRRGYLLGLRARARQQLQAVGDCILKGGRALLLCLGDGTMPASQICCTFSITVACALVALAGPYGPSSRLCGSSCAQPWKPLRGRCRRWMVHLFWLNPRLMLHCVNPRVR